MKTTLAIPDPNDRGPHSRKLAREQNKKRDELGLFNLEQSVRRIMADTEFMTNRRLVEGAFEEEVDFYETKRDLAAGSAVIQRSVAKRLAMLEALNDDTIARYRS